MTELVNSTFRMRPDRAATLWWSLDAVGAILFAAGLSRVIGDALALHQTGPLGALLIFAGAVARGAVQALARIAGARAAGVARRRLRDAMLPALLPSRLIRGRLVGEDMHLAVDAVVATDGLVARFLPLRGAAAAGPLLIALAALPGSVVAGGLMLATMPPFILVMILAGTAAGRRAREQHRALERLSGLFVDRVGALPVILSFGAEARIGAHLGAAARDVARRTMRVLGIAFVSSTALEFFAALCVALVAVYCGFALLGLLPFHTGEHVTLTGAFYVLALTPEFYLGLRRLAAAYHDRQQGEAALGAMAAELDRVPAPVATTAAPRRWQGRGVIVQQGAGSGAAGPAIGPLDWDWTGPGLHVVTGPTGAGKSSLLLALIGHVPVVGGAVLCDGVPLVPGASLGAVGWAGQTVALLPGTVRANLVPGGAGWGDRDLRDLLARLGLVPMLQQRAQAKHGQGDDMLDVLLDHRGSGLSGGERRRLGLARAIASARPVLLLDEPTADLDAASAQAVRAVIADVARERLVMAATHDPALIAMALGAVEIAA